MLKKFIIGAILVVCLLVTWLLIRQQPESTINFRPPRILTPNQEFTIPLTISTVEAINAGEFYFSFPADLLAVKEIKKENSFYALWVEGSPSFDNVKGTLSLAGGLPSPGFSGAEGVIATVVFQAKKPGRGAIELTEASRLLLNDGLGTQQPARFSRQNFQIK